MDHSANQLQTLTATRYVQPLREGGSLPAVVDTDDGLFVVKFRGAGQGAGALIAEIIAGELARELALRVPHIAIIDIADDFALGEPDPEIQDLLRASHGINVGLRYLDGAFNYDGYAAGNLVSTAAAADIVWFDALITNPDRTHRNTNLLVWDHQIWLIDHGSTLYAHHDWASVDEARTRSPFPLIRNHVLLLHAGDLTSADARLAARIDDQMLHSVLQRVPDVLLLDPVFGKDFTTASHARERYFSYLRTRLLEPRAWLNEAVTAQESARREPPQRKAARR